MRLSLDIDGQKEFDRFFIRFDRKLSDLEPVWDDVRDTLWEIEAEQFESEGAAGGKRWQELSARYKVQKINRYGQKPILEASGRLKRAMTSKTSDTIYQKSRDAMYLGTSLKYARYHQDGGKNLPQREVIKLSDSQKTKLQKGFQRGLIRELRRGGIYFDD